MSARAPSTHIDSPSSSPGSPADEGNDLRTYVTVSRTHDADVRQRQILARLDSGPARTLYFGDSYTEEVKPGSHKLRTNNTLFWKTVSFAVEPGEHLEFIVINKAGPLTMSFLALLGAAPLYLSIERRSIS